MVGEQRTSRPAGPARRESTATVLLALEANIGVGLLKLAAGLISGAAFSILQNLHTILGGPESSDRPWINHPVLAIAFVLEAISFRQAIGQVRGAAAPGHRSVQSATVDTFRHVQDPYD